MKNLCIFEETNNKKKEIMKVAVDNRAKNKAKKIMDALMVCIQDPKTTKEDRAMYYSEYLKIAKDYLILNR